MERIKQYKEISKRPIKTSAIKKEPTTDFKTDLKKVCLQKPKSFLFIMTLFISLDFIIWYNAFLILDTKNRQ